MSENTKIEWADHTFNPWIGCTKVGPGCDNCYAKADFEDRKHRVVWGAGQPRSRTKTWGDPEKWNKQASTFFAAHGRRQRVFCASLADVFDNDVPASWRSDLFKLIEATPDLDWLLLTKRIGNAASMMSLARGGHLPLLPNVWIGATIVNQEEADRDIPKLLAVPAARRFLSMEPLLGPVELNGHEYTLALGLGEGIDWLTGKTSQYSSIFGGSTSPWLDRDLEESFLDYKEPRIHWVIVGGESGPNARPTHLDWARSLRDQCKASGVPFLFKQWGEWVDADNGPDDDLAYEGKSDCWAHIEGGHHSGEMGVDFFNTYPMYRVGKKAAGRSLDSRTWDEFPA